MRMNLQPGQSKSSNGYGRHKSDREGAAKLENKIPSEKLNANRLASTGKLPRRIIYYLFVMIFTILIFSVCYNRCGYWH